MPSMSMPGFNQAIFIPLASQVLITIAWDECHLRTYKKRLDGGLDVTLSRGRFLNRLTGTQIRSTIKTGLLNFMVGALWILT